MAAAAGGRGGAQPGPPSAPGAAGETSLLGSAATWPLKRYGRFLPPRDDEGQITSSWKVFESDEESGHLILTIVVSGHFFISQGRTVLVKGENPWWIFFAWERVKNVEQIMNELMESWQLPVWIPLTRDTEGFSLIDSQKWLKIVRRGDCLLLQAQTKNECRMFRIQFGGDSKEQMLEHCCSCVQKLAEYVPVQAPDEQSQQLQHSLRLPANPEHQEDSEQMSSPDEPLPDSCVSLGERRSVAQLAQAALRTRPELPVAYRHSAWQAQELGPFIRLCLMDQHFPAFVEEVEKELQKLTEA